MRENGLEIANWDTPIYRVFSIDRFKEMITKNTTGLVRPAKWDDPFENFVLKCSVRLKTGEILTLRQIRDKWYGRCWTLNPDSDAMWRIYSPDKNGGRVSSTFQKLFSAIYDCGDRFAELKYFIGGVAYKPGFPFSKWTTNLLKCVKSRDGRGFGCVGGGAEVERRWVRRKRVPLSSPSTTPCGLTSKARR